jgi:hypothetical protein
MSVRTSPSRSLLLLKIGAAALGLLLIMLLLLAFPTGEVAADPDYQDFDVPLQASDSNSANAANLGSSVDVSGDTVVVGAPGQGAGVVYVYVRPDTGWTTGVTATETATLTLPVADTTGIEKFGSSVAVSGDTIVVGAPGVDASDGAAYVFVKPEDGWSSTTAYVAELTHPVTIDTELFGESVSVSGDTIVVGAPAAGGGYGRAYVFERPGSGWATVEASIVLSNTNESPEDDFGVSVDVNGDTIVVGARWVDVEDDGGSNQANQGAAYVFQKSGVNWISDGTPDAELTAGDAGDEFGTSVAIREDGRAIVVGAPNAERPDIAGANPPNAPDQGAAYVFVLDGDSWSGTIDEDVLSSGTAGKPNDYFGQSVAISGDTIVVGAPRFRTIPSEGADDRQTGAAFVYLQPDVGPGFDNWESTDAPLIQLAEVNVRGENDRFGDAVAAFGGYIVTGVPLYDLPSTEGALDQGLAYLFQNGYCSAKSGLWHSADTWVNGTEVPPVTADVCVSSYHTVTMDVAPEPAANTIDQLPEVDVRRLLVNPGAVLDLNTLGILVEEAVTNYGTMEQVKEQSEVTNVAEILRIEDSGTGTRFRGADVESTADLGPITLTLRAAIDWFSPTSLYAYCNTDGPASPNYVDRCFTITPEVTNPEPGATVTLWAFLDELNGVLEDDLMVFHFVNGQYVPLSPATVNKGLTGIDLIGVSGDISEFSAFLIGDQNIAPTAVELVSLDAAQSADLGPVLVVIALILIVTSLFIVLRYRRKSA